jgi:TetR/AcrR family transcriptional regulator, transcriptional repressor of bet genes
MPKIVDHDERRRDIALAACRAISKKGLEKVTLVDVAREEGFTTGMLAHYYQTKWEVVLAALRLMHLQLEARLEERLQRREMTLIDLLQSALPLTASTRAEAAAWLSLWGLAVTQPELLKWPQDIHADWRELIRRCVITSIDDASHWPDRLLDDVVSSIICFMDGLTVKALTRPRFYTRAEQLRLLKMHVDAVVAYARGSLKANPRVLSTGAELGA